MVLTGTGTAPILIAPKKPASKLDRIVQEQQDAILHFNAQSSQRVPGLVHQLSNLPIRERPLRAAQGDPFTPPFRDVPVHKLGGGVEPVRNSDDGSIHGPGMLVSLNPAVKKAAKVNKPEVFPGKVLTTRGTPLELAVCLFIPYAL